MQLWQQVPLHSRPARSCHSTCPLINQRFQVAYLPRNTLLLGVAVRSLEQLDLILAAVVFMCHPNAALHAGLRTTYITCPTETYLQ